MNKTKILTISLLLATLAVGCHKDKVDSGYIRVFAENFSSGNNTKETLSPMSPEDQPSWTPGDYIYFNGTSYPINWNSNEGCYTISTSVEISGVTTSMLGLYPGMGGSGYDIQINGDGSEMVINSLDIDLDDDCFHQETAFPMVAHPATNGSSELSFRHITSGFRFTLDNENAEEIEITKLKIILWGSAAATNNTVDGVTVRWANDGAGLPLPQAAVGISEVDMNLNYSSEMNFNVKTNGENGFTLYPCSSMYFCVPVTLSKVQYFTIIGYDGGTEVFNKSGFLGSSVELIRNKMYPIQPIIFE